MCQAKKTWSAVASQRDAPEAGPGCAHGAILVTVDGENIARGHVASLPYSQELQSLEAQVTGFSPISFISTD